MSPAGPLPRAWGWGTGQEAAQVAMARPPRGASERAGRARWRRRQTRGETGREVGAEGAARGKKHRGVPESRESRVGPRTRTVDSRTWLWKCCSRADTSSCPSILLHARRRAARVLALRRTIARRPQGTDAHAGAPGPKRARGPPPEQVPRRRPPPGAERLRAEAGSAPRPGAGPGRGLGASDERRRRVRDARLGVCGTSGRRTRDGAGPGAEGAEPGAEGRGPAPRGGARRASGRGFWATPLPETKANGFQVLLGSLSRDTQWADTRPLWV